MLAGAAHRRRRDVVMARYRFNARL